MHFYKEILLLGEIPDTMISFFKNKSFKPVVMKKKIDDTIYLSPNDIDFIISYRYKHIIGKNIINRFPKRIINLHISMLPWNRGADPNFWSFLENSPKGVSIHYVDQNLDTGPIIAQKEFHFSEDETLSSTYQILNDAIIKLLMKIWDDIVMNKIDPTQQRSDLGSFHTVKDKFKYLYLLSEKGWNTPISQVIGKAL